MSTSSPQAWDYTSQAEYYRYRPNYAPDAIDEVCRYVGAKETDYLAADIGAGTGNLTIMLLQRQIPCVAVEPTTAMRTIGIETTKGLPVAWREGTGESTTLDDESVDWFTMGSSFNTTDRMQTLQEAHRVLKPKGYFTCMWNHRDIENDNEQKEIESLIEQEVPGYQRGVRREAQADIILSSGLFNDIHYIETSQHVKRTMNEYINAWRSVKNKYWDQSTEEGRALFEHLCNKIQERFGKDHVFDLTYVTRIWTARVKK